MAGIQLSGLSSGLDTATIIQQLMSVEKQPRSRMERNQAATQARQDNLKDILAKVKTVRTALTDLQSTLLWTPKQALTSADPARVGVTLSGTQSTVAPGTYDVNVTQMATKGSQTYVYNSRNNASSLAFTVAGTTTTVNFAANATVDDVVNAVNGTSGVGVVARNYNGQLMLEAAATGSAADFTVTGQVLGTKTASITGVNTLFTVNGTSYTSAGMTDTTAIAGTQLKFSGVTATPVRVTVDPPAVDKAAVSAKLKAFVDAYNTMVDTVRTDLDEKTVPKAASTTDAKKGTLFGDQSLGTMLSQLRIGMTNTIGVGNPSTLDEMSELGISTGSATATINQDNVKGKLSFDQAKFDAAWDGSQISVERLLRGNGTPGSGFAAQIDALIKPYTDVGGILDNRISSASTQLTDLKTSMDRFDERMTRREELLRKQFTALEGALAKLNQQSVDLSSKLGSSN